MYLALGVFLGCGGFAGAGAYLLTRGDLGRQRAALVAAGCAAAVAVSSLFVIYLAPLAFVGAAAVYLLLRRWLRVNQALVAMATTLVGLLGAAALMFWVSLTYSM